jgi:hypothetical protein
MCRYGDSDVEEYLTRRLPALTEGPSSSVVFWLVRVRFANGYKQPKAAIEKL